MAATLTIRLDERDREILEAAARERGIGLSAFVRQFAQAEARRLRREAIRADGRRIVAYVESHADARAELDAYGDPIGEFP